MHTSPFVGNARAVVVVIIVVFLVRQSLPSLSRVVVWLVLFAVAGGVIAVLWAVRDALLHLSIDLCRFVWLVRSLCCCVVCTHLCHVVWTSVWFWRCGSVWSRRYPSRSSVLLSSSLLRCRALA